MGIGIRIFTVQFRLKIKKGLTMLEGIIRESIEKSATNAYRQDGYLIANIYGKGIENINAAFKSNEFTKAVKAKETLSFDVKVGAKTYNVVVQDYQVEPVKGALVHVDLKVVTDGLGNYLIPVKLEGIAKGLKEKGVLLHGKRRIKVKCKGADLPQNGFSLNVKDLGVGDSLLIRDVPTIENVLILEKSDVAVIGVIKGK